MHAFCLASLVPLFRRIACKERSGSGWNTMGVVCTFSRVLGLAHADNGTGQFRKIAEDCLAQLTPPVNGCRFPVLRVIRLSFGQLAKERRRLARRQAGRKEEPLGPLAVRKTAQVFHFLDFMRRLGNRFALPFILEPPGHPTVHRFAHRFAVVVLRLEDRMPQFLGRVVELENRLGPFQALLRLADAELEGILVGIDDHQSAWRDQSKHVPFFSKAQCSRQHLAHAACRFQIRLVGPDGTNRDDDLEAVVHRPGVHALVCLRPTRR